jgi:hypothetical protein
MVLRQLGVPFNQGDQVYPTLKRLSRLEPGDQPGARQPGAGLVLAGWVDAGFRSASQIPANMLQQAGVRLYPNDRVYWNGQVVAATAPLPLSPTYTLTVPIGGRG